MIGNRSTATPGTLQQHTNRSTHQPDHVPRPAGPRTPGTSAHEGPHSHADTDRHGGVNEHVQAPGTGTTTSSTEHWLLTSYRSRASPRNVRTLRLARDAALPSNPCTEIRGLMLPGDPQDSRCLLDSDPWLRSGPRRRLAIASRLILTMTLSSSSRLLAMGVQGFSWP